MEKCVRPECNNYFTPKSHVHAFCSDKCRRAARGRSWSKIRAKALWRDSYTCQECQEKDCRLEVHHKKALCKGGDNSLLNLITLCVKCHRAEHKSWRAYAQGEGSRQESSQEAYHAA